MLEPPRVSPSKGGRGKKSLNADSGARSAADNLGDEASDPNGHHGRYQVKVTFVPRGKEEGGGQETPTTASHFIVAIGWPGMAGRTVKGKRGRKRFGYPLDEMESAGVGHDRAHEEREKKKKIRTTGGNVGHRTVGAGLIDRKKESGMAGIIDAAAYRCGKGRGRNACIASNDPSVSSLLRSTHWPPRRHAAKGKGKKRRREQRGRIWRVLMIGPGGGAEKKSRSSYAVCFPALNFVTSAPRGE